MTSLNTNDAALTAAELAIAGETVEDSAPAISRRLIDDLLDPVGPPCVVQSSVETGEPLRIVTEADDDYDTEVELTKREQRERRDSVRKEYVKSAYVAELIEEAKAAEVFKDRPPGTPASRFTPRIPDLKAPRTRWIVKGVMPQKALVVLYGKWGTGKSTLAIELCAAVAQGKPWHGRKVQQGTTVYIASENEHGFRARLFALLKDQGITLDALKGRFLEISGRPHLLKPDDVQELIKELKSLGPISTIVVDTMARATAGGDENAVKETMLAVENCQSIMNATGATVVLVHHIGKQADKGARGSSALPAACDTEIILERPDDTQSLRVAKLGKQRDAADYLDLFSYDLKVVELGRDEDGDPITSTVVREVDSPAKSQLTVTELPNTPIRRAIRSALSDAMRAMPFEEMVSKAATTLAPPDQGQDDNRRKRVRQAYERMIADRELHVAADGMVSLLIPGMPFTPIPTVDANAASPNDDLISEGSAA
jgi:hypothetical protein